MHELKKIYPSCFRAMVSFFFCSIDTHLQLQPFVYIRRFSKRHNLCQNFDFGRQGTFHAGNNITIRFLCPSFYWCSVGIERPYLTVKIDSMFSVWIKCRTRGSKSVSLGDFEFINVIVSIAHWKGKLPYDRLRRLSRSKCKYVDMYSQE